MIRLVMASAALVLLFAIFLVVLLRPPVRPEYALPAPQVPTERTTGGWGQASSGGQPSQDGCTARERNFGGSSPTLHVASGHLLIVDFYSHGGPEQATILGPGDWQPRDGIRVGKTWDFSACPADVVSLQAQDHVGKRGSRLVGQDNGFVGLR